MYKAAYIQEYLLGDRLYPISYLFEEVRELWEAVMERNKDNFLEELQDVLYVLQMLWYQKTKINLPLVFVSGSLTKFISRREIWHKLFAVKSLSFDKQYLAGGSNYRKPAKIRKAFSLAGYEISNSELRDLEEVIPEGYETGI